MQEIFKLDVSVNVHFIPVPAMSYYKNMGYNAADYKITMDNFSREISLPVFYDMTDEQVKTVVEAVNYAVKAVLG